MSTSTDSPPRKLKILMLHGYTQSGPLFHAKTRALEKVLQKAFPSPAPPPHNKKSPPGTLPSYPGGIQLIYPTGPIRLRPSDIPGSSAAQFDGDDSSETDAWAWWKRETGSGEYAGLDAGLGVIAEAIAAADGIDGVIGFSQGACAAVFVASLLERGRIEAFKNTAGGYSYPASFLKKPHSSPSSSPKGTEQAQEPINPPLKFAISYSGFYAPHPDYAAFYTPRIVTPTLHFIGTVDTVVEEDRVLPLIEATSARTSGGESKSRVVYHPGGHFVPIGRDMAGALIGFIRELCAGGEDEKGEERAEDMDVPF